MCASTQAKIRWQSTDHVWTKGTQSSVPDEQNRGQCRRTSLQLHCLAKTVREALAHRLCKMGGGDAACLPTVLRARVFNYNNKYNNSIQERKTITSTLKCDKRTILKYRDAFFKKDLTV